MPRLQYQNSIFYDKLLELAQILRRKANIFCQRNWIKPEFGAVMITVNVYVWWFVGFVTIKIEFKRPNPQNRWHKQPL